MIANRPIRPGHHNFFSLAAMSQESSFDIVSKVDLQEMDNAVNQVRKEMAVRYDFRGSQSKIELEKAEELAVVILADDSMRLRSLKDLLHEKMARRGVAVQALDYQAEEKAEGDRIRQRAKIRQGIGHEDAKEIVKQIKELKLKVQAAIQDDLVRVRGKKKDDLQTAIQAVKNGKYKIPLQFTNYR